MDKKSNGMSIIVTDSEEESKEILNEESKEILNEERKDLLNEEPKEILNEEEKKEFGEIIKVGLIDAVPDKQKIYYCIVFCYNGGSEQLKVEENEKMKDIIKRYTDSIIKIDDPNSVFFLYGGGSYFYDNKGNQDIIDFGDQTVEEFANRDDKKIKGMSIVVFDYDNEMDTIEETNQNKFIEDSNTDDYIPIKSEDNSTHIIFIYNGQPFPLKVEENEKLKDAINRYGSEIKEDTDNFEFYYKNSILNIDSIGDKTVGAISYVSDKTEPVKKIDIIVKRKEKVNIIDTLIEENDNIRESVNFFKEQNNNSDLDDNDSEEINIRINRIRINIYELSLEKKFHIKSCIILLIQYIFILITFILGFIYKLNEKLIYLDIDIRIKYVPVVCSIIFLLMIFIKPFMEYKFKKIMIFFEIIYPFFIIYYCFLFSEFLDYKYFIIGVSLIIIQILSYGIYNLIIKNYQILHLILISISLNIIALIFFGFFWIKDIVPTLLVATFPFGLNLFYLLWLNFIKSFKEFNYYYSVLIYNYHIFLGISLAILAILAIISFVFGIVFECFEFIKNKSREFDYPSDELRIFRTFLIQFFIIGIFVSIGIVTNLNKIFDFYENRVAFGWTFGVDVVFSFILCVYLLIQIDKIDGDCCCYFYIIIYIPIIILFFFVFSSFTSDESIISFILVIFFKLFFITLFLLFYDYNWKIILLISFISDGINIPFQFLYFPELMKSGWVGILVISCVINIYITAISGFYYNKEHNIEEVILITNYGFFIVGYAIALVGAAIAIALAIGIIYLIVQCISCLCSGDN